MAYVYDKRDNAEKHEVKKDDTLEKVAKEYADKGGAFDGMDWEKLAIYNWGTKESKGVNRALIEEIGCAEVKDDPSQSKLDPALGPEGIEKTVLIPKIWKKKDLALNNLHKIKVKKPLPPPTIAITKLDKWFIPETETCDIDYRVEGVKERASKVDLEVYASNYCKAQNTPDGEFLKFEYTAINPPIPIYQETLSEDRDPQADYEIRNWKGKSQAKDGVLKPREGNTRYINTTFSPYTIHLRYYTKDIYKRTTIFLDPFWPQFDDGGKPYEESLKIKWTVDGTPKLMHGALIIWDKNDQPVYSKGLGKADLKRGEHEFDWKDKAAKDIREANMPYRVQIQAHTEMSEDAGLAIAVMHTEVRLFTHDDLGKKNHALDEPKTLKFSLAPLRPETTALTAGDDDWYHLQLANAGFHPGPVHGNVTTYEFQKALKEFQRSYPKNNAAPFERLTINGTKSGDTQTALARLDPDERPLFGDPTAANKDDITDPAIVNTSLDDKDSSLIVWVDDRHYYTAGAEYAADIGLGDYRGGMSIGDQRVVKDRESIPRPWVPVQIEIALKSKNDAYDSKDNFPAVTPQMRRAIGPVRVDWSCSEPDRELGNILKGGNNYRSKTWIDLATGRAHGGIGGGIAYPAFNKLKEGQVTLKGTDSHIIPHLKKAKLNGIHVYNEAGTVHYDRHSDYFLRKPKSEFVSIARNPTGRITDGQKVKVCEYPENAVFREGTVDLTGTAAHAVAALQNAKPVGIRVFNDDGSTEYNPHSDFRVTKNNGNISLTRIATGTIGDGDTVIAREDNVFTNCPVELPPTDGDHDKCGSIRPTTVADMAQYYKKMFGMEGAQSLKPWMSLDDPDAADALNNRVCTIAHDDLGQAANKVYDDYRGKTGIYFRPSFIAGDGFRLRAQVSFKKLPGALDHPNQEILENRYPRLPQAHTASMRIWRKSSIRGYINWTSNNAPDSWRDTITNDVNPMYHKAFVHFVFEHNDADPFPLTGGDALITALEYKNLVEGEFAAGPFAGMTAVFNHQYIWPFLQEPHYGFAERRMNFRNYYDRHFVARAKTCWNKIRTKLLHLLVKKIEANYGYMRGHLLAEFESSPNAIITTCTCDHPGCNRAYTEVINHPGTGATKTFGGINYEFSSASIGLRCNRPAPPPLPVPLPVPPPPPPLPHPCPGTFRPAYRLVPIPLNACGLACGASWLFLPRRNDTWAHEMGHHRHMQHAQSNPNGTCTNAHLAHILGRTTPNVDDGTGTGTLVKVVCGASPGAQLNQHDSQPSPHLTGEPAPDAFHPDKDRCWDRHCMMSYDKSMDRLMCGKCILKQRGWAVQTLANPAQAIQDEP